MEPALAQQALEVKKTDTVVTQAAMVAAAEASASSGETSAPSLPAQQTAAAASRVGHGQARRVLQAHASHGHERAVQGRCAPSCRFFSFLAGVDRTFTGCRHGGNQQAAI